MKNLTRVATIDLGERKASPDGLRTYPVTLSTETSVPRRDMYGARFDEVLSHAPGAVDLSRAPIPVIESHDQRKVNVGVVTNLRLENKKLRGDLVLGKSARAKELADDIDAGIVTGVSIGYAVNAIPDEGNVRVATRWTLYELSIVSVPADVNAGIFRSANPTQSNRSDNVKIKRLQQQEDGNGAGGGAVPGGNGAGVPGGNDAAGLAAQEAERVNGIRHAVKISHLGDAVAQKLIASGTELKEARGIILDMLATRSDEFGISSIGRIEVGTTDGEKFQRVATQALIERAAPGLVRLATERGVEGFNKADLGSGREFMRMSLFDLAVESLRRNGVHTRGMGREKLVGMALTTRASTGDFPILLENAIGKVLLAAYETAADTWRKFSRVELVPDFRDANRYRVGTFGSLPVVPENAEYHNTPIPDGSKLTINTETRGGIISLSRQAIINDDMGALSDLAVQRGRAAMLTIENEVYRLLALNGGLGPTMSDTFPFFDDAARANVSTTAALSVAAIDADRVKMGAQMDSSGQEYLNLRPSILLVPAGLGGAARVFNDMQFDGDPALAKPNSVRGLYADVVDSPRLAGTRRYSFADPAIAPAIIVVGLEESGLKPFLETQQGWRVDGTEWKVRLDAKVNFFDAKGAVTNAG